MAGCDPHIATYRRIRHRSCGQEMSGLQGFPDVDNFVKIIRKQLAMGSPSRAVHLMFGQSIALVKLSAAGGPVAANSPPQSWNSFTYLI